MSGKLDVCSRTRPRNCAVIVEPLLQGARANDRSSRRVSCEYRRLTIAHDVLLIADEVLTGFLGRTGRMLPATAPEFFQILCASPRAYRRISLARSHLTTDRVHDAFTGTDRRTPLSFTGTRTRRIRFACAAANANLHIFDAEPVLSALPAIEQCTPARPPEFAAHPAWRTSATLAASLPLKLKVPDAGYLSSLSPALVRVLPKSWSSTPAPRKRGVHPAALRHNARPT